MKNLTELIKEINEQNKVILNKISDNEYHIIRKNKTYKNSYIISSIKYNEYYNDNNEFTLYYKDNNFYVDESTYSFYSNILQNTYKNDTFILFSELVKEFNKYGSEEWNKQQENFTKKDLINLWNKNNYQDYKIDEYVNDDRILADAENDILQSFNEIDKNTNTYNNDAKILWSFSNDDYILLSKEEFIKKYCDYKMNQLYKTSIQDLYYKLCLKEKIEEIKETFIKENEIKINAISKLSKFFNELDTNIKSLTIILKDDSTIKYNTEKRFYGLLLYAPYLLSEYNFKVINNNGIIKTYSTYRSIRCNDISIFDIKEIRYRNNTLLVL